MVVNIRSTLPQIKKEGDLGLVSMNGYSFHRFELRFSSFIFGLHRHVKRGVDPE